MLSNLIAINLTKHKLWPTKIFTIYHVISSEVTYISAAKTRQLQGKTSNRIVKKSSQNSAKMSITLSGYLNSKTIMGRMHIPLQTPAQLELNTAFPHHTLSRRLCRFGPQASGTGTQMYGDKTFCSVRPLTEALHLPRINFVRQP